MTSSTTCQERLNAASQASGADRVRLTPIPTAPRAPPPCSAAASAGVSEEEELKEPAYKEPGARAGEVGKKASNYHPRLTGAANKPQVTRIQVNALGQLRRPAGSWSPSSRCPQTGLARPQRCRRPGEGALPAPGPARRLHRHRRDNGQILGLGSATTYDTSVFTRPLTRTPLFPLPRRSHWAPLTDRATPGL